MRQEFRKQLTQLRKIQDRVLRQQSKHNNASMHINASNIGSNTVIDVWCYRGNSKSAEGNLIWKQCWDIPHDSEVSYKEMLDEINVFFFGGKEEQA